MKFSKDKKGVELTFNTIVIMVLVLLVLVILAFMLIKGFGTANTTMNCKSNGGECGTACPLPSNTDYKYPKPWGCDTGVCCSKSLLGE